MPNIFSLILCLLVCSTSFAQDELTDRLFSTIDQRLSFMEQVALFKAQNGLAIEDLEREAIVIQDSKRAAQVAGLDPTSVEEFFRAQIALAKIIQYRYRALWLSQPSDVESVDLDGIVRPRLSQLGDEIIALLAEMASTGKLIEAQHRVRFHELVQQRFVEDDETNLLFDALQKVTIFLPIP